MNSLFELIRISKSVTNWAFIIYLSNHSFMYIFAGEGVSYPEHANRLIITICDSQLVAAARKQSFI